MTNNEVVVVERPPHFHPLKYVGALAIFAHLYVNFARANTSRVCRHEEKRKTSDLET